MSGPRAPSGRPGLRIARSYGANIGGPEGRGCLAPGAVPARRAGTSPGSAAVTARQAPPGAPGILEGPAGRRMRLRAHSLTHGMRAILTQGIFVKGIRRKIGRRHECKISYSWPAAGVGGNWVPRLRRLQSCRGCTAADNAAVAPELTRFRAHSLTHARRAILTEGIVVNRIRRKLGRRHECKISYSWRLLRRPSGAPRAGGGRGPRAPSGRRGLRIARSYGANIGGPEGRGCLAPGAVPARRAGTSPGSAAGPARQAPPGAPGILEGPVGRRMRFRAHSLTHGMRAILMEGIVVNAIRRKIGRRHECKISYSWPAAGVGGNWVPRLRRLQSCRGCTAANNAAVAPELTRLRAHSLTHGMRAILTQGILVKGIRRKSGARHECKISYSWPGQSCRRRFFVRPPCFREAGGRRVRGSESGVDKRPGGPIMQPFPGGRNAGMRAGSVEE